MTALERWLPFMAWARRVNEASVRADLKAALTGAVIVLPQGVAFASIAGLPPQYGLYAAMVPTLIAALWGSSWHLVTGPTTAISIVVFASVSPLASVGTPNYISLALTLTLLVGLIQLTMGLARLGSLVTLISHTVLVGFTTGAAFLIAASQLKNFLGLDVPQGLLFHQVLLYAATHLRETHAWAILVGLVSLIAGLWSRRHFPSLPYMVVAMVVGSVVAALINFLLGAENTGIVTVGAPTSGLPPLSIPDLSIGAVSSLMFPALIIALLGLTEAVAIARALAAKSGQRIDNNQEFVGQGLANSIGCFFSAYTTSGSFNRSGANYAAGARTPLAAAGSALFLLLIVLLAAPLVGFLPVPTMAAVLFIIAWGLVDFESLGEILRRHPRERTVLLLTLVGTLVDLEKGLFLGILASLAFYLYQSSRPMIQERVPPRAELGNPRRKFIAAGPDAPGCPQLALLAVQGPLYFGATDVVSEALQHVDEEQPQRKWVFLMTQGVGVIDLAGARLLVEEASRRKALGGGLYVLGAPVRVLRELLRGGQVEAIGRSHFVAHKGDALSAVYPLLDSEICRHCRLRVFHECQTHLPDGSVRAADPPTALAEPCPVDKT